MAYRAGSAAGTQATTRNLTAADVMTPGPRTCSPFSTVTEAALIFQDEGCGALPVVENGRPVGMLTDRDVALAAAAFPDLPSRRVSEIMTKAVVSVAANAPLERVKAKFSESGVRRLLVLDAGDQLVGIIARADLARYVLEQSDEVLPQTSLEHERARTPHGGSWTCPSARAFCDLLREAGSKWVEHRAPRLGAAIAYYTVFSIAPLLLIAIAVAGMFFGRAAAQGQIAGEIQNLVGRQGAEAIEGMIASARQPTGHLATGIAFLLLFFGAMGLFGELQDAINTLWEVPPKPGPGWLAMLKDRLLSFTLVIGTIFLLLVSLIFSAGLAAMESHFGFSTRVGQAVDFSVSFVVITVLFAMIYRFLPDARVAWKDVFLGAAITSLLFALGKTLIGLYLGHGRIATAYGAAGSLVALMIWAYYSAQIFLFGVTFTQAFAKRYGSGIGPEGNTAPVTSAARAERRIAHSKRGLAAGRGGSAAR
jgi:membrane protein